MEPTVLEPGRFSKRELHSVSIASAVIGGVCLRQKK